MPSRNNLGRRVKGVSTPIVPIFTSSRKGSPKARRKIDYFQKNDEELEVGQAVEEASPTSQAEHPAQSTTDPAEPNETDMNEDEVESEAGSGEKSPLSKNLDEELVIEGPGAGGDIPEDDAADEIAAEEEAAKERERIGKAKVIPQLKVKKETRIMRWTGEPTIRKPEEHMVIGSSDSSGEEDDQPETYDVYPTVISEDIMDDLKKYKDTKSKGGAESKKDESKSYGSGHLVDIDSLINLGIFPQVADKMTRIGWGWLLTLDEFRISVILCKEFISTFTFSGTTNLSTVSIQFNLFGERFVMSINEWTSRMWIYTTEKMENGQANKWERGTPGKQVKWDKNETWKRLTRKKEGHMLGFVY